MNAKSLLAIIVILFLPMMLFAMLSKSHNTYAEKVLATKKPQIIKFSSAMCLDCKTLKKNIDKVYPKYADEIELIEIQVQDHSPYTKKQIERYNVTLVPTMILLDKNGNKISRYEGNVEEAKLDKIMKDLIRE